MTTVWILLTLLVIAIGTIMLLVWLLLKAKNPRRVDMTRKMKDPRFPVSVGAISPYSKPSTKPEPARVAERPPSNCLDEYLRLKDRPAAMVAEGIVSPGSEEMIDVMFFTSDSTDIDSQTQRTLLVARRVVPISPDNAHHRTACRRELAIFAETVTMRLAAAMRRGRPREITADDEFTIDLFHAVFAEHEPNTVVNAFSLALERHHGGTQTLDTFFLNKGRPMPKRPFRSKTGSLHQMTAATTVDPTAPTGLAMPQSGGQGPTRTGTVIGSPISVRKDKP